MSKTAIIDGDGLVYRAAFSVERTRYGVIKDGQFLECDYKDVDTRLELWSKREVGKLEDAFTKFDELMERINERTKPDYRVVYLTSGRPSFRHGLARLRAYKGNRTSSPRPTYFEYVREHAISNYGSIVQNGWEADDLVSVLAKRSGETGSAFVVVGNDKDLDQIVGDHYDWQTDTFYAVSPTDARIMLWMQVLMGDPGDNIGGCWRTGLRKATNRVKKWIEEEDLPDWRIFDEVVEEYRKSQKMESCPYANDAAVDVVEETLALVRLKTTMIDSPWTRITIRQKDRTVEKERDGRNQGRSPATEGSSCASGATGKESAKREPEIRGLAPCATASER